MIADHPTREERYAAVLAEHPRGDWSDRTYNCQGCAMRFEQEQQAKFDELDRAPDREDQIAFRNEYAKISHPGWTRAEYEAHVAAALAAADPAPAQPDAALSAEEREALGDWWDSDWPADAPHVLVTLYATVERILTARAAQPVPAPEVSRGVAEGDDGPCQACGKGYPAWRADNALWNLVMGGPDAKGDPGGMLCPVCFLRMADERAPIRGAWVVGTPVRPERVVKAEALREFAAIIAPDDHHCFRPQGCADCGRQKARQAFRTNLIERADRLERGALGGERGEGA